MPAFFIGLVYRELAIGYLNTGRDLRRMESNSRSPIFSDFGELLEGIVTVRAFSAERRFLNSLHARIDNTTKVCHVLFERDFILSISVDVVVVLDDESMVAVELRRLGCGVGLGNYTVLDIDSVEGRRPCWVVYHQRDDLHVIRYVVVLASMQAILIYFVRQYTGLAGSGRRSSWTSSKCCRPDTPSYHSLTPFPALSSAS